jgi:hypothetical protein
MLSVDVCSYLKSVATRLLQVFYHQDNEYVSPYTKMLTGETRRWRWLIIDRGAKTYDGEKTTSSTNVAGKTGSLNKIHVCHPIQVPTQSGLRTLISDINL